MDLTIPQTDRFDYVGRGSSGLVYRISEDAVIKLAIEKVKKDIRSIERESAIMAHLYEKGISVPRPYGVITLKELGLDKLEGLENTGIVMEYINGINNLKGSIGPPEYRFFRSKLKEEKKKVKKLKTVRPRDAFNWNAMWIPQKREVVLIDFEFWRFSRRKLWCKSL